MNLHEVNRGIRKNKRRRRVGRGPGSGWGKTSGRGHKGQGQLAGWTTHPAFEGGQMPLSRRVPKRGFNNRWARSVRSINLGELAGLFDAGAEVSPEILRERGILRGAYDMLKILGNGEFKTKLKISAHKFSKSAKEKIAAAGGEAIELPAPAPVVRNKQGSKKAGKAKA